MTQQNISASYRSLMSAVDVIVEQALDRQMMRVQAVHAQLHPEPEAKCPECIVLARVQVEPAQEGEAKDE